MATKTRETVLANTMAFPSYSIDDVEKARAFYHDRLGLGVEDMTPGLAVDVGGGSKVFLYPRPDHSPATFTVLNFAVDDVEKVVGRLAADGIRFESYDQEPMKTDQRGIAHFDNGASMAWFKDPAGNILSVVDKKP